VINAPATASVIPEQTIRDASTRHMADLLRAVPGINVAQMSVRQLNVTSRSATEVLPATQLVLIDGRKAYTMVNASGGVRWGGGKYITMLKVANLANTPVQNHVLGDILKRQITGEIRMRF
jgi:outer membrane receptor for ferrienterochelin and colicin